GDVDAEVRLVERGVLDEADRFLAVVEHLDAEPQRLELLDEHLEGFRDSRGLDVLALHDRLVRLDTTHDVVGLDREELLQDVGSAVRLERPHLHLAEALSTELGLSAQRLLRDERVRARRACVDLVLDEVVQLHHVDVADGDRLLELLALDRKDLRDDALVAVAPGHLVADADLALLRDRDPDHLVDARKELVIVLAAEDRHVDDLPVLAGRKPERGVLHLTRLLAEDRAEQTLLGRELGLAFRRDLADEDVLRPDLGADVDDPVLVEVGERLLADVRDVARDLLGAELGVTRLGLVLLDVDRGELVILDDAVAQDDRVLVVPALPGHKRDEDVLAKRELAFVGRVAVGQDLVLHDAVAHRDQRTLVEAGALVGAHELLEAVTERVARILLDPDLDRADRPNDARRS